MPDHRLDHHRYCAEIVTQAELTRDGILGADLAVPVPSCPEWTVGQLVRHLGFGYRWVSEVVRTRPSTGPDETDLRGVTRHQDTDPDKLGAWLVEGAEEVAGELRAVAPDEPLWTPLPSVADTAAFWPRRFTHESVVHRADAVLALGRRYTVDTAVAADAMDEWLDLAARPEMLEFHPHWRPLIAPDRAVGFQATDTGDEWLLDLSDPTTFRWRPGTEGATAILHAPVADLLLTLYQRRPRTGLGTTGDESTLDTVLAAVAFG